jgi:hypothetical protein
MRAPALAAIILTLGLTGAAQADPAKCLVEIRRQQPLISGPCDATFEDDGGFTLTGTGRNGAEINVSIFTEGDGTATGLLDVEAGNNHSYDDLGSLRRRGPCWGTPNVVVCAARAEPRPEQP